ncbi:type II toxin-antitoxin system antitoxin DNA ADP-ribosyl glycohydrolase DarG [Actinoplanes sp. RD1]|uniref:type II toxin-antitoxin system antitoxin DNA ADP-ribosyl glycohydrolase DarG n=1 Tax=Actinoplanes sp. RD1 TaxID=3064538 RepID=UPI002741B06E|nr:macro domain-containing protein [Actinoplanes sp. RD1]
MINSAEGDLLAADVEALVNTVNCVGVMGKGLALQFKRRYPGVFRKYEQACRNGDVRTGHMHVVVTDELHGPRYVINFPTKKHWRSPSRLEYIDQGLTDLVRTIRELGITSIAIPPLGAGNGGLHWPDVAALIERHLGALPDVDVQLFAPATGPRPIEGRPDIRMTWGRAVLIDLLQSYVTRRAAAEPWEDQAGASHLEIQKLMYFANEIEPALRLSFTPGRYGPYSERVRHLIQEMEGSLLMGHGDGSAAVLSLEPIAPTERARTELANYQESERGPAEQALVHKVLEQVAGFEGPYGLELLASTHWVVHHDRATDDAAERVRGWTKRKGRIFTDAHVSVAYDHLQRVGAL